MKGKAADYLILDQDTGRYREDPEQAVRDDVEKHYWLNVNLSIKSRQGKRIAKRSPVRSCTELGFCNPEQHEGADC